MKFKVNGKLVDDKENPLSGIQLKVITEYSSFRKNSDIFPYQLTDENGEFEINFTSGLELLDNKIKIEFLIEDKVILSAVKKVQDEVIDFGLIKFNQGNIGVAGQIIDERGNPLEGLTVIAEDVDFGKIELNALELIGSKFKSFIKEEGMLSNSLDLIQDSYQLLLPFRDDYLGSAVTDKDGLFRIMYPQERYREFFDKEPDIRIIVKDKLGVFDLRTSEVHSNISTAVENMGKIIINRSQIEGWQVTLGGSSPFGFTSNNNIEILIDNHRTLEKIVEVIDRSKSYIYLTQFEFYPDFFPRFFRSDTTSDYEKDDTLVYKLLQAQNRGVDVKLIINENMVVPDNFDELYDYFKESEVEVRRFPAKGPYAMHAKVLVVDGIKAFIIGSPFAQSYWDTSQHRIKEPRRLKKDEGPVHDVSIYLEGPVVNDLEDFFIDIWNYLSTKHFKGENKIKKIRSPFKDQILINSSEKLTKRSSNLRFENESLQVVRSITPETITGKGERGVLEAYRKAITNANDFIYLENQYFTNKYIIAALKKVIELKPDLQLILLINEVPDVPTYRSWQHYGFEFMGLDLGGVLIEHPQIGVFAKWSGKFQDGKKKLRNCYIHSKVAVIDDKWSTIGTSNIDGSSLSCAEEFGSREKSRNYLNMEINALMFDNDNPPTGSIEKFRKILWSEHLGTDITNLDRPSGGWLDLWKEKAYENISQLEKEKIVLHGGILPYSTKKNAKEQIKDIIEQYRRMKGRLNR